MHKKSSIRIAKIRHIFECEGESSAFTHGRRLGLSADKLRSLVHRWRSKQPAKRARFRRIGNPLLYGSNEPKIKVISHIEGYIKIPNKKGDMVSIPKIRLEYAESTLECDDNEEIRSCTWEFYLEKLGHKAYLRACQAFIK